MTKVKINFSIEINDHEIIAHSINIEQNSENREFLYTREQKLAVEIINKMNELYTEHKVYSRLWEN